MKNFERFEGIEGFYLLTADRILGYYDKDRRFRIDTRLTEAFLDYVNKFLNLYEHEPDKPGMRVGMVTTNDGQRAWQSATLLLVETVVKTLYPVTGVDDEELTTFQRRNSARSIYQGMELLLEYENKSMPGMPVFCPVLYDRGTDLDQYQRVEGEASPVLEVLNLVAPMDPPTRRQWWVSELIRNIYNGAIDKGLRKPIGFSLLDDPSPLVDVAVPMAAATPALAPVAAAQTVAAVAEADTEFDRQVIDGRMLFELRRLDQLARLNEEELVRILQKTKVVHQAPGESLIRRGSADKWNYYLMEGEVELESDDRMRCPIKADSPQARYPLSFIVPRQYDATALTDIRCVCIDREFLEFVLSQHPNAQFQMERVVRDTGFEDSLLFRDLYQQLMNETLVLPTLPEIARSVRAAILDPEQDLDHVIRMVEADPAIAAKLIKAATDARTDTHELIDTCPEAIQHLGLEVTRKLVTTYVLRDLFRSESPLLTERMQMLWRESTEVAAIAFVLARVLGRLEPEHALLAGLLHRIGAIPIITQAEKYPDICQDREHLDRVIDHLQCQLSGIILRNWDFSPDIVTAALEADDWYRDPGTEPDYCDLVIIARLHRYVGGAQSVLVPRMDELPAFRKLAPGQLTPQASLKILNDARAEVEATQKLLIA